MKRGAIAAAVRHVKDGANATRNVSTVMSETLSDHHAESRKPLPALRLGDAKQVSAFMGKADMLNPLVLFC